MFGSTDSGTSLKVFTGDSSRHVICGHGVFIPSIVEITGDICFDKHFNRDCLAQLEVRGRHPHVLFLNIRIQGLEEERSLSVFAVWVSGSVPRPQNEKVVNAPRNPALSSSLPILCGFRRCLSATRKWPLNTKPSL